MPFRSRGSVWMPDYRCDSRSEPRKVEDGRANRRMESDSSVPTKVTRQRRRRWQHTLDNGCTFRLKTTICIRLTLLFLIIYPFLSRIQQQHRSPDACVRPCEFVSLKHHGPVESIQFSRIVSLRIESNESQNSNKTQLKQTTITNHCIRLRIIAKVVELFISFIFQNFFFAPLCIALLQILFFFLSFRSSVRPSFSAGCISILDENNMCERQLLPSQEGSGDAWELPANSKWFFQFWITRACQFDS